MFISEYWQQLKNTFNIPIKPSSFEGCYCGELIGENVYMSIKSNSDEKQQLLHYSEQILNQNKPITDKQSSSLRKDGVLVRETTQIEEIDTSIRRQILGNRKIADTQVMIDGKIIRHHYDDYAFKGAFGGYWFSANKYAVVYERCDESKCDKYCSMREINTTQNADKSNIVQNTDKSNTVQNTDKSNTVQNADKSNTVQNTNNFDIIQDDDKPNSKANGINLVPEQYKQCGINIIF